MRRRLVLVPLLGAMLLIPLTVWGKDLNISALLVPNYKLVDEGRIIDTSNDAPILYNNKTYVPLRLVSESLGYEVKWDGKNQTVHFAQPDEKYPLIENDGVELVSVEHNYDLMTAMTGNHYLGNIKLDFVYQNDENLDREPVLVMEMLNKDKTVLASVTKLLDKSKGTHQGYIHGEYIRLPYDIKTDREQITKLMSQDYYYRLKIK